MKNPLAPEWLEVPNDVNELDPRIWPKSVARNESGQLTVGKVSVSDLATGYGTPLYVLDQDDFEARLLRVNRALGEAARSIGASCKVYYAGKVLLTTDVVRLVREAGLNLDVASGGELAVALAGGMPPERIGLHGNNKSLVEIGRAVAAGVGTIVVDSEIEIERIASIAGAQGRVQNVRLRVNTGVHAHTHEYLATAREDQKFGVAIADVPNLVAKIRADSHLNFLGLHSHIGSQIFVVDGFIAAVERLLWLHKDLLQFGPVPELNLGGGFGIAYTRADRPLPIEDLAARICRAVQQECEKLQIPVPDLAFEPGRVIAGPAMFTLYNVGTVKDVQVSDGAAPATRRYLSVDGGMSDNARPALYEADYSATLASRKSIALPALSRVVGKHCESGDIVVRADYLPNDVSPNDLIAVPATGAYCFSLSSNYNYLTRPAMVAVKGDSVQLMVRAETESDLLSRDMGFKRGEN